MRGSALGRASWRSSCLPMRGKFRLRERLTLIGSSRSFGGWVTR